MDAETPPSSQSERAGSHWAAVAEKVIERIAGPLNAAKKAHATDLLEQFESDLAPHVAPYLEALIDNPAIPAPLRELFAEVSAPKNLTSSLIIGIAVGAILSPAIQSAFAPVIQHLDNEVWPVDPNIPLPPAVLANAVIKGIKTEAVAAEEATWSGVSKGRFSTMVDVAGQSLGAAEALLLWRRGQIDEAELDRILRYSNVRPDFFADVKKLRFQSPSTGAVLAGAVQNHLTDAEARDKYQEAGGNPVNYAWEYESHGRPPGTEQMLHLLNRGLVTEAEARQSIRESDIKNKYIDAIIETRVYLPPPRSVVPMLRHGAITEAEARAFLANYGAPPNVVAAFIAEAGHSGASSARTLTQSQIARMYGARFIDRGTATARLTALNFPAQEIELLLNFVDGERIERALNAGVSKVGTLYVGHKIDKATATTALMGYGLDGAAATELFQIWDIERTAAAPNLTVAQWQGALRRGLASHAQFDAAMAQHGYSPVETDLLAGLAFPAPRAATASKSRDLSVSQLVKLYQSGGLTLAQFRTRLTELGYSAAEANEIISLNPIPSTTGG